MYKSTMSELNLYSRYKSSGVEWLGKVPAHWNVVPNRAIFNEIKDHDCPDEQMLSVTIKKGVILQSVFLEDTSKKDGSKLDRSNYKLVQPGDIAYNKMRAWQGAIGVSYYRGIISPAYVVQRPKLRGESRYFHQLFRIPSFAKEAERWSYGIASDMWSLRPEHFKLIYSCRPPLPEQKAIVRYLNYFDRRIRRYLAAKQKLIGLLEEQKQTIIHHAVTRGLDPDVPLKDSGVEWLGKVPEHWEIKKLKILSSKVQNGVTPPTEEPAYYTKDGLPWYSPPSLGAAISIGQPTKYVSNRAIEDGKVKIVEPPALAISVIGNVGKCALLLRRGATNQQITCFTLISRLCNPNFVTIQFRFSEKTLVASASSSTIAILDSIILKATKLALPPLPEQTAIVEYLDKATATIDTAITRARREIELLNEYRTRLTADVVTGKLDVREAAAGLPDESDAPESFNQADSPADALDTPLEGVRV